MTPKFSAPDLDQLYVDWQMSDKLVLPDECTIVVAGAFEGRLMRLLAEMYPKHHLIVGFEPQMFAAERCFENTRQYPRMVVCMSGLLADKRCNERLPMGEYGTDACSMLGAPREQGDGVFSDAYVQLSGLGNIDLFVMNLEGYEYHLLEYLAEKDHDGSFVVRQWAVQFHVKYQQSILHTQMLLAGMEAEYGKPVYDDYPKWMYWTGQQ